MPCKCLNLFVNVRGRHSCFLRKYNIILASQHNNVNKQMKECNTKPRLASLNIMVNFLLTFHMTFEI